jgi:hypothetical protein
MPEYPKYVIAEGPAYKQGPALYTRHNPMTRSVRFLPEDAYWRENGGWVSLTLLREAGHVTDVPKFLESRIDDADATITRLKHEVGEANESHDAAKAKSRRLQAQLQVLKAIVNAPQFAANDELKDIIAKLKSDNDRLLREAAKEREGRRTVDELQNHNNNQARIFKKIKASLGIGEDVGIGDLDLQVDALVKEKNRLGRRVNALELEKSTHQLGSAVEGIREAFIGGAREEVAARNEKTLKEISELLKSDKGTLLNAVRQLQAREKNATAAYHRLATMADKVREKLRPEFPGPIFHTDISHCVGEVVGRLNAMRVERDALRATVIESQRQLEKTRDYLDPLNLRPNDLVPTLAKRVTEELGRLSSRTAHTPEFVSDLQVQLGNIREALKPTYSERIGWRTEALVKERVKRLGLAEDALAEATAILKDTVKAAGLVPQGGPLTGLPAAVKKTIELLTTDALVTQRQLDEKRKLLTGIQEAVGHRPGYPHHYDQRDLAAVIRESKAEKEAVHEALSTARRELAQARSEGVDRKEVNRLMDQLARIRNEAQPLPPVAETYSYFAVSNSPQGAYRRERGAGYEYSVYGSQWVPVGVPVKLGKEITKEQADARLK